MYPFLFEEAKIKRHTFSNGKLSKFMKSVREQYGNPDSHAFFEC